MKSTDNQAGARALLERIFELTAHLSQGMQDMFETEELTSARVEVLWRVAVSGPQTQRALSDALRCTPRNVTGLVDALTATGLVSREPHPTDGRATLVTLTDAGDRLVADWHRRYDRFADRLFGDMPHNDLRRLQGLIDHVLERLRDDPPGDR